MDVGRRHMFWNEKATLMLDVSFLVCGALETNPSNLLLHPDSVCFPLNAHLCFRFCVHVVGRESICPQERYKEENMVKLLRGNVVTNDGSGQCL